MKIRTLITRKAFWISIAISLIVLDGAIVVRDMWPRVVNRWERRTLGRIHDDLQYFNSVEHASRSLLLSSQDIPVSDQTRLLIIDDIQTLRTGNPLRHSSPEAFLAKGVISAYAITKDPNALIALEKFCSNVITDQNLSGTKGRVRVLDQTALGETLIALHLYTKDNKYRRAADCLANYLIARSRSEGNALRYRPEYLPSACFVDTLAMICPFLACYGAVYNSGDAEALAISQLREFHKYGIESRSGLPFHGYDASLSVPFGLVGWGRGTGWYAMGLIDTIGYLPINHPDRQELAEYAVELAKSVVKYQQSDGGWNGVLNMPGEYDSSSTALLAYFLQRGINIGVLPQEYDSAIVRGIRNLQSNTRANGTVDYAQGDCQGISRLSSRYEPSAYVQGLTLGLLSARRQQLAPISVQIQ